MTEILLKRPKAIIFDWDNTLVDTSQLLKEACNTMMKAMGYHDIPAELDAKIRTHKSTKDSLPEIFGERWQEAERIYKTSYLEKRHNNLKLMPHTVELLDFLQQEKNIYLAIVSNKTGNYLREELNLLNINHYFTKTIGSLDTPEDKPSPIVVDAALHNSNISAGSHVWFIGDNIVDIQCAHNSGCTPILYSNGHIDRHPEPDHPQPVAHFKSHQELIFTVQQSK